MITDPNQYLIAALMLMEMYVADDPRAGDIDFLWAAHDLVQSAWMHQRGRGALKKPTQKTLDVLAYVRAETAEVWETMQ